MTGLVVAILVLVGSAIAALLAGRRDRAPSVIGAAGVIVAAIFGLPPALASLGGAPPAEIAMSWAPPIGELRLGIDPLSAFFIVPLLVLGATCAIYGAFYLDDQRTRRRLAVPACFYNLLIAAMLVVLISRDAIVFVVAWEVMTLASYLLVTFDHQIEARRAGWVYLVASHLGIASVLSMFVLLGNDGGFGFGQILSQARPEATGTAAAILGLVGFGVKAGIVPLHIWLPEAHAAAPSHVSALMSGVLIKLGIYGILRTITLVGPGIPWGPVLLVLGIAGALVGIALALYQRDIKRVLAYSSVENIGVILIGLGIGLWGAANDRPVVAALGLCGGLFHVWNHAVMKGLMFLTAGSLVHGTGTRDLEQLGGVLQRMPHTGRLAILGSVAISALPPLNGFASEWLVYLGLAHGGMEATSGTGVLLLVAVAALAAVGVMAALCFVRLFGLGMLGQPRSAAAAHAHESSPGLVGPMVFLGVAAVAMPFLLPVLVELLEPVIRQLTGKAFALGVASDAFAPITVLGVVLWSAFAVAFVAMRRITRRRRVAETWGCGYTAPTARMQYSSASFSEGVHRLLPRPLRARITVAHSEELFPELEQMSADRQDPFTRSAYEPLLDRTARRFGQLRWVQQGMLHMYILYVVLAVIVTVTIVSLRDSWVLP